MVAESAIMEALASAVTDECDAVPAGFGRQSTAADVPGWDSLAHVRIMMNLEARLGIEVDIDRSYRAATMGDLIDGIVATAR